MKRFGTMLDCSRNAVPTVDGVQKWIDILSDLGYNTLLLYMEDTYEIRGEPYFGYMRGRYTEEELREMDVYAKEHGVELIPCIQALAHLQSIERWPEYWGHFDCADILCVGDERNYKLIEGMFATLARCFSTKTIHIGMDEAFLVGRGRYYEKFGQKDRFQVMLEHLERICKIGEQYGFTFLIWSDMFFNPNDKCLLCWGVGNHGGGPSEEDWAALCKYQKEHPEIKMIPCGTEEYFETVDRKRLQICDKSLVHCMIGCYTSMVRIKQKHRQLENELAICEKMLAASGVSYDEKEMKTAEKALLFSEFHDSLPGTMVKNAEEDMLRQMDYGREILAKNCVKAFFKLCEGQPTGKRGEIPILVFNPNPYWVEQEVEVEFQLEEQNFNVPEVTLARVRTPEGVYLPTQNIKEDCTFNLDWRKRIVFRANLKPMSMNRFDCELYVINEPKRPIAPYTESETHFLFKNERMQVAISKETGLIDQYCVDGVDYLKTKSAQIRVYDDNEDPWRMQVDGFYHQSGAFQLVSNEEANVFNGYPQETIENVRVIENGDVITRIQAIFKHANSFAVVTYTMSKFDIYVDVRIKLYSNDANKMYKLSFPTTFEQSKFVGQMAFGTEELLKDEKEVFYQKWCGLFEGQKGLAVLNNGTYGGSCKDSTLNISLLRTPVYSAHPIGDRQIAETDRNLEHMDMGEREFTYRLTTDIDCLDAEAERFNQRVYALSFFPSGQGESKDTLVELTNKKMLLTRYDRGANGKCCLRIYNASEMEQSGSLQIEKQVCEMSMRPFEYHTYEWVQGKLRVID